MKTSSIKVLSCRQTCLLITAWTVYNSVVEFMAGTARMYSPIGRSAEFCSVFFKYVSCYNSRECHMLAHFSSHFTGCRFLRESSSMSQFWRTRYALLLVRRTCTRCCRTASVNLWRHCGRLRDHCYTCHEPELSTADAPLVSLRQLYGTVCLLTSLTLHH